MLKTVSSTANAIGALNYKGTWNASTNTPTLASGVGTKGDYYVVSVAGSTTLDGLSNWGVGDWAVFNGSVWQRVEGGADLNGVNLTFTGTASGPTYETSNLASGLTIANNSITADGTDTNINIALAPKGTGQVTVNGAVVDRLNRAGNVLQVVNNSSSVGATSTTSTSFVDITNATATITPSSTSNKILVLWTSFGFNTIVAATNTIYYHQVLRNATALAEVQLASESSAGAIQAKGSMAFSILDAPSTTSAVTYKVQHKVNTASSTGTAANGFLTLMEIAQ